LSYITILVVFLLACAAILGAAMGFTFLMFHLFGWFWGLVISALSIPVVFALSGDKETLKKMQDL